MKLKPDPVRITRADADGFAISVSGQERAFRWDEVDRITAFKRDLYVADMICLLLLVGKDGAILELSEQTEGYNGFVSEMEANLPGITGWAQWFMAVAFPAFATNPLCIYRRGGEPDPLPPPPGPEDESQPEENPPLWSSGIAWIIDKILAFKR